MRKLAGRKQVKYTQLRMSEEIHQQPLDLAGFDDVIEAPVESPVPQSQPIVVVPTTDTRFAVVEAPPRLVEIANLSPNDLAAGKATSSSFLPSAPPFCRWIKKSRRRKSPTR
jgi:hypothetical protein